MRQKKWEKFTEAELKEIFETSTTYKEIAEKLGYTYSGNTLSIIKEIAKKYNFTLSLKTKSKEEKEQDKKSLIGEKIGRLTVLSLDEDKTKEKKKTYFKCQCSCEDKTLISVRYDCLIDKKRPTLSCGCLQKETVARQGIANRKDLTGQTFKELTVISYNEEQSQIHGRSYWNCKCSCGNQIVISANAINNGQASCGCLNTSIGEFVTKQILSELNIPFETQYAFPDLKGKVKNLTFDFFLPTYKICIECQGQQHFYAIELFGGEEQFELQREYDSKKKEYCKKHNIKLIEIPYRDYKKINEDYILNLINN